MKTLLLSLLLASSLGAHGASTILVDFGNTETPSTEWNHFSTTSGSISLNDTTGTPTGYTLSLSGSLSGVTDNPTTFISTTPSPFNVTTVISDIVFTGGSQTLTLSNLTPGVSYDLTFYSYVSRGDSRRTSFTVAGYTPLVLEPANTSNGGRGETGNIDSIIPDAEGRISVTIASEVSNNWILNGLAISYTIPEPSAALLSTLGLIPLLRRRR